MLFLVDGLQMHEKLWSGAELKLEYASFHLERMREALQPPLRTAMSVALESSGALVDNDWQRFLYPHLDAFLPCVRSVPDIVNWCLGRDGENKRFSEWFEKLSEDEKERRTAFVKEFMKIRVCFDKNVLTNARNISVHRSGQVPVEVAFKGFWGVSYIINPTIRLASHEVMPSDGSDMGWLSSAQPLRPLWTDFKIGGQNLFEACQGYLADARDLLNQARNLSERVHGTNKLTEPPS